MAFRLHHSSAPAPNAYSPTYPSTADPVPTSLSGLAMPPPPDPASPSLNSKRRLDSLVDPAANQQPGPPLAADDSFIQDHDAAESGADDDDDEDKPKSDKKAGRRKIKIEFIQDKSRRHITFSKRKAGIMKKAYELSTLTGTQVLLLVVSETGLVYTFTTAKLQPLVTQPEGKNLIQACLNAPHGQLPSSLPVGTPIGRSSGPMAMPGSHQGGPPNVPGGLSISGGSTGAKDDAEPDEGEADQQDPNDRSAPPPTTTGGGGGGGGRKRRRTSSSAGPNTRAAAAAAAQANQPPPQQPLPAQGGGGGGGGGGGPTTSPHARSAMPLPPGPLSIPMDTHRGAPTSPNYGHAQPPYASGPGAGEGMYPQQGQGGGYPGQQPPPPPYGFGHEGGPGGQGPPSALPWGPPVQQGTHYGRR